LLITTPSYDVLLILSVTREIAMSLAIANVVGIITTISQLIKEFVPHKNDNEFGRIDEKFQELINEVKAELVIIGKEFSRVKLIAIIALCFSGLTFIGIIILLFR
jgi:hypothetical protein